MMQPFQGWLRSPCRPRVAAYTRLCGFGLPNFSADVSKVSEKLQVDELREIRK